MGWKLRRSGNDNRLRIKPPHDRWLPIPLGYLDEEERVVVLLIQVVRVGGSAGCIRLPRCFGGGSEG